MRDVLIGMGGFNCIRCGEFITWNTPHNCFPNAGYTVTPIIPTPDNITVVIALNNILDNLNILSTKLDRITEIISNVNKL